MIEDGTWGPQTRQTREQTHQSEESGRGELLAPHAAAEEYVGAITRKILGSEDVNEAIGDGGSTARSSGARKEYWRRVGRKLGGVGGWRREAAEGWGGMRRWEAGSNGGKRRGVVESVEADQRQRSRSRRWR